MPDKHSPPSMNVWLTSLLIFALVHSFCAQQCSLPSDNLRIDCYPANGASESACKSRGCCWFAPSKGVKPNNPKTSDNTPYCYYPTDYPSYVITSQNRTNTGIKGTLTKAAPSYLPKDILKLQFEVIFEKNTRIRLRITDPNVKRFEVPIELDKPDPNQPTNPNYDVIIPSSGPFSIEIKRKSDGMSLFKSFGPLLYSDQFIQITTTMSVGQGYGIGEQNRRFLHKFMDGWTTIGLWNRDNPVGTDVNLYGTHPFFMAMPDCGKAFGIFFFNSNAQEFSLQPTPALTYRTIGGIIDMFVFTGDTPEATVQQYTELVGRPMLPPFWSLGFHLSRYGYKDLPQMSNTLMRNLKSDIPIEVQWSDIDYMDSYRDFTFDNNKYKGLDSFVDQIKKDHGIRYIVIIDPAISNTSPGSYPPFDEGMAMNIFVIDSLTKKPLVGTVWPGLTVFPDFSHPNSSNYWTKQNQRFYDSVKVDGLWIDMNEPSNFDKGSHTGCDPNSPLDNPFYTPHILDNSLIMKTLCSSALHYNNIPHYNLHNLYGYMEAVSTNIALTSINPNKRVFILSRSTFSGSGKYTFHWTGDNTANWDQLAQSIRQILNFNMFGIPMAGSDICGFLHTTTEELCIRWMQLGSFYPFMRNHNDIDSRDQDPASWSPKAQEIMKRAINIRYAFLPYFSTLFVKSHLYGGTVMRPMSFEFYSDPMTYSLELQFMVGSAIMVIPVVKEGATTVDAYFPPGVWYNLYQLSVIASGSTGKYITLNASLETINIALRGGSIIPLMQSQMTTDQMRKSSVFVIYSILSLDQTAEGDMYWDDGESLDSYTQNKFTYIKFSANSKQFLAQPVNTFYDAVPPLSAIVVGPLQQQTVTSVIINGNSANFTFSQGFLMVGNLKLDMKSPIKMTWS